MYRGKHIQERQLWEEPSGFALQRHNTENLKQIFPEKELRGLSPNFHMSASDFIYSHGRSAYSAAGKYVDPILGIYISLTVRHVTGNDQDYLRKIPRVVVQKSALL